MFKTIEILTNTGAIVKKTNNINCYKNPKYINTKLNIKLINHNKEKLDHFLHNSLHFLKKTNLNVHSSIAIQPIIVIITGQSYTQMLCTDTINTEKNNHIKLVETKYLLLHNRSINLFLNKTENIADALIMNENEPINLAKNIEESSIMSLH